MMKNTVITLAAELLLLAACMHDPVVPTTPQISFKDDITPIVVGNCAQSGCHDGGREGFALKNYEEVMRHVNAGQPYKSKLFTVMASNGPNRMPPNNPLPNEQVKLVYIWILQGALNN